MSEIVASSFPANPDASIVPKVLGPQNVLANVAPRPGEVRTSGLAAPTIRLTGHEGEIYCVEFNKDGTHVASSSFDRTILVYNVYGDCENFMSLSGHQNAILQIQWSSDDPNEIYSCSADRMICIWDVETGKRTKKMSGHAGVVNSCNKSYTGTSLVVSGSDDGTTKMWDLRIRRCARTFEHNYQILSVTFDRLSHRIFSGSLDHTIRVYDLRKGEEAEVLMGHQDSITSVAISNDGGTLASFAMDQTLRFWDVQPFSTFAASNQNRCTHILSGPTHNFEKNLIRCAWDREDKKIACGSADRYVYIWDVQAKRLMYRLPGHDGSVNHVSLHPREPIVASGSSDKTVYLGELS